jgi:microcystin-dependent protein
MTVREQGTSGTITFVSTTVGQTATHSTSTGGGTGGVIGGSIISSDDGTIYSTGYFETSGYYESTWENPIAINTLSKYLTSIPASDSKKIVSLLEDNARSLEDHLDTAYLKTSGGTVYGPTTLAGDLNIVGTVTVETRPLVSLLPPPGSITMFGGTSLPAGWLNCDGAAVSRTDYATLWATIGSNFGAGNGTTTFNLPNFASNLPQGTAGTPGSTGGSLTVTIASANLPTHTHTLNAHTHGLGSHTHTTNGSSFNDHSHAMAMRQRAQSGSNYYIPDSTGSPVDDVDTRTAGITGTVTSSAATGNTGASTGDTGNGGFANTALTLPYNPYVTVRYIIKT